MHRFCLAALTLLLAACSLPGGAAGSATRPADFAVRYEWYAGSMPPPYHYEYLSLIHI